MPAAAVKVAVVVPPRTRTEGGTLSMDGALLDNATVVPDGAAPESVTVQVVEVFWLKYGAAHSSEDTVITALGTRDMATDWLAPLRAAVIWATPLEVKALLVAVKAALVALGATVTELGTVRLVLSEDRATTAGEDAAALRATVQVNDAEGPMEFDPQETLLGVGPPPRLRLPRQFPRSR
jgi:hypothetical protein